jgi:DnaJ-domain-containing protein 1
VRGTYLYAVMAGDLHLDLGQIGLPNGATEIATLSAEGLSALVSEYEGAALKELPKAELLNGLVVHQQVIELAMAEHSVLPVKFGTILASPDEVREALRRYRHRLDEALVDIGDAVEIDLSATWDPNAIIADIAREPQVTALAAVANDQPDEDVSRRIQVGRMVAETLEQKRDDYRRRVVTDLVPLARDTQPNPLPSEEIVFNLAFLVERTDLSEFEAAVDRLGDELGDRLAFRYVGPLPPHSFATIELIRPDPDEIESASRVLDLGEQVSEAELRQRYRELAAQYHPDRNPGDFAAQERFATLATAHQTLSSFLRGQRQTEAQPDADRHHDLTPDAVAGTLLLEIRRADIGPSQTSEARYESGVL